MKWRRADAEDIPLLAEMNTQLIADEGHRIRLSSSEMHERWRGWLCGEYEAVLFSLGELTVAYALHRLDEWGVYVRQFFVRRDQRRKGLGRLAFQLLVKEALPRNLPIRLEVLVQNKTGRKFWEAVGFKEYATTLEYCRNSTEEVASDGEQAR